MNSRQLIVAFVAIFTLLLGMHAHAQKPKVQNLPKFDKRYYHFGFSLGLNSTIFEMDHDLLKGDTTFGKTLTILEAQSQAGFNLGIIAELHLGAHFAIRFVPSLMFSQRDLIYTYKTNQGEVLEDTKPVESTFLHFPLNFKFRSARLNNFAAYVLLGFQYTYDLASKFDVDNNKNAGDDIVIKLQPHTFGVNVGFGLDFFLPYFKFSPVVKYTIGLGNIFIQDNTKYSMPVQSLRSHIITIAFTFEG